MRKNSDSGSLKQPYSEPRMKIVDVNMAPLCQASTLQNESYDVVNANWF